MVQVNAQEIAEYILSKEMRGALELYTVASTTAFLEREFER
jgi:hypothetical protein